MKVRAVQSFAGPGVSVVAGAVLEMPDGADWLRAGLVVPVVDSVSQGPGQYETAAVRVPEGPVWGDDVFRPGHRDDLTLVPGVGASTAEALNGVRIFTFGDLVAADPEMIAMNVPRVNVVKVKAWQAWLADNAQ